MSDLRVKTDISTVTRYTDDGKWQNLRGLRDGAMIECDWILGLALEGKVFCANVGTGTGPIACNDGYTAAKPDLMIAVPTDTTIIPLYIEISLEDTGTAEVADIIAVATNVYDAAVTGTEITPYNVRLNSTNTTSLCVVESVVTALSTTPIAGNYVEFFRGPGGKHYDAFQNTKAPENELISRCAWGAKEALCPPVIVGEGSLYIYASSQNPVAFITVMWAELLSTAIV